VWSLRCIAVVSSPLAPALLPAAGVVVGALLTAVLAAINQEKRRRRERTDRWDERRYELYTEVLQCVADLENALGGTQRLKAPPGTPEVSTPPPDASSSSGAETGRVKKHFRSLRKRQRRDEEKIRGAEERIRALEQEKRVLEQEKRVLETKIQAGETVIRSNEALGNVMGRIWLVSPSNAVLRAFNACVSAAIDLLTLMNADEVSSEEWTSVGDKLKHAKKDMVFAARQQLGIEEQR
jgi:gas vesicle protein